MRTAFRIKGLPECALSTMEMSLSTNTIKQYSNALQVWWNFYQEKNISPYRSGVQHVLEFFQTQLEVKQFKYGTFNSWRSALALILPGEIGKDLTLRRYFRGIF